MPTRKKPLPEIAAPAPAPVSVEVPPAEALAATNTVWEVTLKRGVLKNGNYLVDTEVKKMYYIVKEKEQHSIELELAAKMKHIVDELIRKYRESRG